MRLLSLCLVLGTAAGQGLFGGFPGLGRCSCVGEPAPRGSCMEQAMAAKDCAKGVFGAGDGPSPAEIQEKKAAFKELKKDIVEECFQRPCKNPKKVMKKFKKCIKRKLTQNRGVLTRFRNCIEKEGVEIPPEVEAKIMRKFNKEDDEDDEDDDDEKEMKGRMMAKFGGKGVSFLARKQEKLEKMARAVCPRREARQAAQCAQRKLSSSGLGEKSGGDRMGRRGGGGLLGLMAGKGPQLRKCSCRLDAGCKADMSKAMDAVCQCKNRILGNRAKSRLRSDVKECAEQAGANYVKGDFDEIISEMKKKTSQMCSPMARGMMKMMSCN